MRNDKRQEALEKIRSSKDIRLILISFKAGSTGRSTSAFIPPRLTAHRSEPDVLQQRHPDGPLVEPGVGDCLGSEADQQTRGPSFRSSPQVSSHTFHMPARYAHNGQVGADSGRQHFQAHRERNGGGP